MIHYFLRRGELLNFVGVRERRDWTIESWTAAGTVEECLADYAGWHADVHTMIRHIETPYKWALMARDPMARWSLGRVTLLGDACHPMLPFLAQGANSAIEDGYILSRALEAHGMDVTAAFRTYDGRGANARPASSTDRPTTRNAFTTRCWEIRRRRRPMWNASGRRSSAGAIRLDVQIRRHCRPGVTSSSEIGPTKCEDNSRADNLGGMLK